MAASSLRPNAVTRYQRFSGSGAKPLSPGSSWRGMSMLTHAALRWIW